MLLLRKRRRDYHEVMSHVDPKRLRKQERGTRFQRFLNRIYGIIILGTLIWLGYFVFFTPFFMLSEIKIVGHRETGEQEFLKVIGDFLNSRRYWIFFQKNFFILDEAGLGESLNNKFVLSKLEISKKFPKKLNIQLKERVSVLNLCLEDNCYKIDYSGQVTTRLNKGELDESLLLVYYKRDDGGDTGGAEEAGESEGDSSIEADSLLSLENEEEAPKIMPKITKIDSEKIHALLDLFEILKQNGRGAEVESMEIYGFDGLTKKITVNTRAGYKVFFNDENDLEEQVNNFDLILSKEIKNNIGNIEYIDLRFGDKIYYK